MCGIIYAKNLMDSHPVNSLVKILYQNQKDRGQQGFGFVGLNGKQISTYRSVKEKGIMKYMNECQYSEIMFHHRFPTSTENTLKSTHPFIMEMDDKRYYFMHNGIIQNARGLKEEHAKKGIKYSSQEGDIFNDSEVLGWDFCLWLNGRQKKVKAEGSAAFVCLEVNKTNQAKRLYFYRNSEAPLKVYKDDTLLILASEGNYPSIPENCLCYWDYREMKLKRYGKLEIKPAKAFSLWDYDYSFLEDEDIEDNIAVLEQERDYLVSVGRYAEAEELDDEIEYLKGQPRGQERLI